MDNETQKNSRFNIDMTSKNTYTDNIGIDEFHLLAIILQYASKKLKFNTHMKLSGEDQAGEDVAGVLPIYTSSTHQELPGWRSGCRCWCTPYLQ